MIHVQVGEGKVEMDMNSAEWLLGYSDGYNNRERVLKSADYELGYKRGFSDAVEDFRIPLRPKIPLERGE